MLYLSQVHGLMTEDALRKTVDSWSCIRAAPRPYDKALHAAFVSTGNTNSLFSHTEFQH